MARTIVTIGFAYCSYMLRSVTEFTIFSCGCGFMTFELWHFRIYLEEVVGHFQGTRNHKNLAQKQQPAECRLVDENFQNLSGFYSLSLVSNPAYLLSHVS